MNDALAELLLNRLDSVDARLTNHGQEMRQSFAVLSDKLDVHAKEDHAVEVRVAVMEADRRSGNERRQEEQQRIIRRTGFIAAGLSAAVSFAILAIRILWDWLHP